MAYTYHDTYPAGGGHRYRVVNPDGNHIATCYEQAYAGFIVRALNADEANASALNSHADLLAACEEALDWIQTVGHDGLPGGIADRVGSAIDKARGAT